MTYQGMRDFRTETPAVLRSDLQRQNALLEQEFQRRDSVGPWRAVRANRDARALVGDAVFVDASAALKVFLPSSRGAAARSVRVCRVAGSATVTVVAPAQETVNGAASVALSSSSGWSEFMADGSGGWWVNH
jgi:hypothetical protein